MLLRPATARQPCRHSPATQKVMRNSFLLPLILLAACVPPLTSPSPADSTATLTASPAQAVSPSATEDLTATAEGESVDTPPPPGFWHQLPVVPIQISPRMRQVYQAGLERGNDPRSFSKIGDCASAPPYFLTGFDRPDGYRLGTYAYLQPVIDYFRGSFGRVSLAAKAGLNTSGILTTLWTNQQCQVNEPLLDCEYRLNRPSFAFISLGTNEAYYVHHDPDSFERNLRVIIEDTLNQGIVPILATKADNVEGDDSINATIARLALEYEVPFWNFWAASYPLPGHGLADPDHLSTYTYVTFTDFSDPRNLEYGMQVRNLTALQVLNVILQEVVGESPTATPAAPTVTP
jgi:hypothetical protein